MGYLIIDHSQGQGLDGKQGAAQEYETASCNHCGSCIAILKRANTQYILSTTDIAAATQVAPHVGQEYIHKRRCRHCKKNICRACEEKGGCNPMYEQVNHALKSGGWDDAYVYKPELKQH